MQQRFRNWALFMVAGSLAGAGILVVACGTDNGTTPNPTLPTPDASKDGTAKDTGPNPDQDGSIPDGGGADADCSNNPKLRDFTANFRCAFLDGGAGSDAGPVCQNTQTCCNTSDKVGTVFQPAFCSGTAADKNGTLLPTTCTNGAAAAGSTFTKGNQWECADKNACGNGQICCMIQDPARLALDPKNTLNIGRTPASDTKHPQACNVQRTYNEGGSRCRTPTAGNCPDAKEIKLCSLTDNNCGAGTTCTPFIDFTNFIDRGFCK